jgi:hypothetical protein
MDGCYVGWPRRSSCGFVGSGLATCLYSQWNELKLTHIGYQKALSLLTSLNLSPHGWLLCGVAPPEILWLHRVKISYTPLLSME